MRRAAGASPKKCLSRRQLRGQNNQASLCRQRYRLRERCSLLNLIVITTKNVGAHADIHVPFAAGAIETLHSRKHSARSSRFFADGGKTGAHGGNHVLVSRAELARRWGCSIETLKRREKAGVLNGLRLSARMVRYALDEVLRVERDASCGWEVQNG